MPPLKAKIQFYRNMSAMTDAGLSLARALRAGQPPSLRSTAKSISDALEAGEGSMSELMCAHPEKFGDLECRLIEIGEKNGKLELVFKRLAEWYTFLLNMKQAVISGMTYPVLQLHFAAVLIPLIDFFIMGTGVPELIGWIIALLSIFYIPLLSFLIWKFFRMKIPSFMDAALIRVPIIGKILQHLDYARFFYALGISLGSGQQVLPALKLSASTCRISVLRIRFFKTAHEIDENGKSISSALEQHLSAVDKNSTAVDLMRVGEESGKIDETALRIAGIYKEKTENSLKLLANIMPKIFYIIIVLWIAWKIINLWSKLYASGMTNISS